MGSVIVLNLENGATVPHSVVLIEGEVQNGDVAEIGIRLSPTEKPKLWPVIGGRFKALVELEIGVNKIDFTVNLNVLKTCVVHYHPPENRYFVRLLYVVAADDIYQGHFQGPAEQQHNCTQDVAFQKIILGAKLIQTFTSECFYRFNLERRTFRLHAADAGSGQATCERLTLKHVTTSQAQKMSQNQLWTVVKDELASDEDMRDVADRCKFLAFLSFTRYVNDSGASPQTHHDMLNMTRAHCALGGGGLALMGTGCLHTWPTDLQSVLPCFNNTEVIDRNHLLDDSAYRRSYWACYATTLGATCHELGHTFGLCHTKDGIMGRGFDNMNRVFVVQPPPSSNTKSLHSQENSFINRLKLYKMMESEWEGAFWTRETALWLYYQKWFNSVTKSHHKDGPHLISRDVRARHGIRVIILIRLTSEGEGCVEKHWSFEKSKGILLFRLPFLQNQHKKQLMIVDSLGNTLITTV